MPSKGGIRTPEQKEQILEMTQMRLDGYTFQEIADKFKVTKQCVQQKLAAISGSRASFKQGIDIKVIYPNLATWMHDNGITKIKLSEIVGMKSTATLCISKKLYGETDFKIQEVKKILEHSGQTFEYMFAEKVVDDESE